jgi:two-component system LytT family response regulator
MNQFRAIIIDDERNMREALSHMLGQYCPEIELVGTAASAPEGRELLENDDIDFIFLDISMPKEDGLAFLRTINKEDYCIIFTTAYQEYALRALKANAIDYLLKPVNPAELREAVTKAIHYYRLRFERTEVNSIYKESLDNLHEQVNSDTQEITKLTISNLYGFRIVNVSDLMYLQADGNYTVLHLSGFDKIVATRLLGDFEKMLENQRFFRIHKSTLINMHYLQGFSHFQGAYAELSDGTRLTISRRKIIEFRDAVSLYTKTIT